MRGQDGAGKAAAENAPDRARKPPAAGGGPLGGLLALQSTIGNAAVVQMLRAVGHLPAQEQHRHGGGCGHQQAEPGPVQRSAVPDVLRTTGRPLDGATRTDMEARLGADFSDVRVHNDAAAKASAAEVGARAYTSGSHVVLGDGGGDKHTLAHELTHVIQQRRGPVAGTDNGSGLSVSDPSDRFEREAEATATAVMARPLPAVAEHRHAQAPVGAGGPPLQRAALAVTGEPVAVQRIVRVSPQMYMQGMNVTPGTITAGQLLQYVFFAVKDDLALASRLPNTTTEEAAAFQADMARVRTLMKPGTRDLPAAVAAVTALVGKINAHLENAEIHGVYESNVNPTSHPEGPGAMIPVPNRNTRYATTPSAPYTHTPAQHQPDEPRWGDDETMFANMAAALGPGVFQEPGMYPEVAPRTATGGTNLPLKRLTWQQTVGMLPRPLLNLLFDVRFQLEAPVGSPVVVDERTNAETAPDVREKSPSKPGTLRSWHQDAYGRLPNTNFDPAAVPANAAPLHDKYSEHSQSGAGSSITTAIPAPVGLAEYTGTGSNWEHNTKVVLDYVNKRVYLTLTHYQYWALIPSEQGGAPYAFWQSPGQDLAQARGALGQEPRGDRAIMMSPWLEIAMT
ncbi:DUF4157 domain-containing protein [Kitasatospora sp. NBC_00315]|uniref:eCIS core domain-containing protein n=1 Tax=Kitasatospora sp. NBC_00315 TaxID=2975963 RepID=UPI003243ED7E